MSTPSEVLGQITLCQATIEKLEKEGGRRQVETTDLISRLRDRNQELTLSVATLTQAAEATRATASEEIQRLKDQIFELKSEAAGNKQREESQQRSIADMSAALESTNTSVQILQDDLQQVMGRLGEFTAGQEATAYYNESDPDSESEPGPMTSRGKRGGHKPRHKSSRNQTKSTHTQKSTVWGTVLGLNAPVSSRGTKK